jgi:hypothetical protein
VHMKTVALQRVLLSAWNERNKPTCIVVPCHIIDFCEIRERFKLYKSAGSYFEANLLLNTETILFQHVQTLILLFLSKRT